jgi:hypothetical protein
MGEWRAGARNLRDRCAPTTITTFARHGDACRAVISPRRRALVAHMLTLLVSFVLALAQEAAPPLAPTEALGPETLSRYRALIAPTAADEEWRAVPWRASFWQGVIDAQAADRPVLLFTMNGHPFGCT